ncbi:hypothetical protein H671_3g10152 [Cricetulus griseus]|nr:hypothetical protein H671_3g10152 [Cricetulus griseus]
MAGNNPQLSTYSGVVYLTVLFYYETHCMMGSFMTSGCQILNRSYSSRNTKPEGSFQEGYCGIQQMLRNTAVCRSHM